MRKKQGRSSSIGTKGSGLVWLLLSASLLLGLTGTAHAQSTTDVAEWGKRIQSGHSIGVLGTDLFGDSTSYYDGSTSFSVTDIDLPGNNSLPVRLGRTLAAEDAEGLEVGGLMANWNLDIPYISGVFSAQYGWKTQGSNPYARCSNSGVDYVAVNLVDNQGLTWDYWRGNFLNIPGHGKHSLLGSYAGPTPTDGQTTRLGTLDFSQVRCLSSLANPGSMVGASGEGFLVTDSSGTQYTFNWMTSRPFSTLTRGPSAGQKQLQRMEVRLYPTQIQDRFGNTVTYHWSGSELTSISSSDGRTITFSYNSNGTIASAVTNIASSTTNSRTWQYSYNAGTLTGVLLPDGSSWSMSTPQLTVLYDPRHPATNCDHPGEWQANLASTFTFRHPSGAYGSFTFSPMRHGRTQVTSKCFNEPNSGGYVDYGPPILRDNFALTQKQITGPSLPTLTWSTSFSAADGGYSSCTSACPADTKTVTVTNPDNSYTVYTYGIRYYIDEGKLFRRQTYTAGGALVRDESTGYALNPSSPPYAMVMGNDGTINPDNFSDSYLVPRTQTTLLQDNDTYTNTVNSFDNFARSLSVTRSNSFGGSRTDVKAYFDDTQHWVLGQVKSSTNSNTGTVEASTDFSALALPVTTYRFGLAQLYLGYNGDGTMATVKDGLGYTATLSMWNRGAPQKALFPDGYTKYAAVDDNGWISSTTDARGNQTTYGYDSMGRDTSITYPPNDTVNWAPETTSYAILTASELGIPAGSWRARTTVGRLQTSTYYDGLWRPVLVEEKDTNTGGAVRYTATSYDYASRPVFKSYPSTASNPSSGINSTYDTLGRLTQKASTDGTTLQTVFYLSGSKQQVKDASLNVTTTTYQAFDAPSGSNPTSITTPTQTTWINRNVLGEITSVQQSGAEGTLGDSYIYDGYHRLCKRIEPETGQTVVNYDAASRITWTAKGQSGSATSCDYGSVPASAQIAMGYDPMGRPISTTYPDGSGDLSFGYDPDGHLASAANPTASWSYPLYNKRGLLETEQATIDGRNYTIKTTYDVQANVQQRTWPDGTAVAFDPDAWGRPSRAGTYALNVAYYPNNIPSSFVLGNGLRYSAGLDSRLRLQYVHVVKVSTQLQSLSYGYNDDNDLTDITDGVDGADTASFQYDGSHRLTMAQDYNLWGTYNYSYDAFNNIKTRTLNTAANLSYSYNYGSNQLSSVSGAVSRSYFYDNAGRTVADGSRSFNWNQADEITGIPGVASYAYDANGKRIKTTKQNGIVEYALYDRAGSLVYTDKIQPAGTSGAAAPVTTGIPAIDATVAAAAASVVTATAPAAAGSVNAVGPPRPPPSLPNLSCVVPTVPGVQAPTGESPGSQNPAYVPTLDSSYVSFSWCGLVNSKDSYYELELFQISPSWQLVTDSLTTAPYYNYYYPLSDNSQYAWWVRSCLTPTHPNTCSQYSPTYYFQTPAAPGSPPSTPGNPSPGSTVSPGPTTADKTVTLSWSAAGGASSYTVQVVNQSSGATEVNTSTSGTSYQASLSNSTAYRWSVNACNASGCSSSTATLYFQTPAPPPAPPPMPANPSPGSTASPGPTTADKTVTLSWSAASGASSYTVQVLNQSSGATVVNTSTGGTSYQAGLSYSTPYSWSVNACNSTGCSSSTATLYFQTPAPPPSPPPTPANPSPGSTSSPGPTTADKTVTLSWSAAGGATSYTVQVLNQSNGTTVVNTSTAGTSYQVGLGYSTPYRWSVNACNSTGCSSSTGTLYFQTPAPPPSPPPTPANPSPGSTSSPGPTTADKTVTLSWSASSGATSYTLQVLNQSSGATVVSTSTSGTSYQANLSYSTPYSWSVSACNPSGCSSWTATLYFQTPAPPAPVETLTDYLSLHGQALAEIKIVGATTTVTYLHADLLGSPRLATDASQNIVWREHYEPYGQKMNGVAEKLGYTGHAYDAESQLTYMKARFYDAAVGRFLSGDPIAFKDTSPFTFNRYAYANDNPETLTDPTGKCSRAMPNCEKNAKANESSAKSLIRAGNALARASDKVGTASAKMEVAGMATAAVGLVTAQPEVTGVGVAMASAGGAGSIAAEGLQVGAGIVQMAGGATDVGKQNVVGGAVTLATGAALSKAIVGSKAIGPSSASERAAASSMKNSAVVTGSTIDTINTFVEGLQPHEAPVPNGN